MDGNRQGLGKRKMTFVDKVGVAAKRLALIDLMKGKEPAQSVPGLSSYSVRNRGETTGYTGKTKA